MEEDIEQKLENAGFTARWFNNFAALSETLTNYNNGVGVAKASDISKKDQLAAIGWALWFANEHQAQFTEWLKSAVKDNPAGDVLGEQK